jgi:hypothetical protein
MSTCKGLSTDGWTSLFFTLLKYARDQGFDRLIKMMKGKASISRIRSIRERHQSSSGMSRVSVLEYEEGV